VEDGDFVVVTLAGGSLSQVRDFVAWYLDIGAAEVRLYVPQENSALLAAFEGVERVTTLAVTPERLAAWGLPTRSPDDHGWVNQVQLAIGDEAYGTLRRGWLLRVDDDELIHTGDRSLPEILADIGPEVETVRVAPAERLSVSRDGVPVFRTEMPEPTVKAVYGEAADAMVPGRGLVGHRSGKSFTRAGLEDVRIHLHGPKAGRSHGRIVGAALGAKEGVYCLHLNDDDFEAWCAKMPWRLYASSLRPHQGAAILTRLLLDARSQAGDLAELRALHSALFSPGEEAIEAMLAEGCGFLLDLDLEPRIGRVLGDVGTAEAAVT
jgi:hypothetical protein